MGSWLPPELTGDFPPLPIHPHLPLRPDPDFDDRHEMRSSYPGLTAKYW